jgi:hypothetical protein
VQTTFCHRGLVRLGKVTSGLVTLYKKITPFSQKFSCTFYSNIILHEIIPARFESTYNRFFTIILSKKEIKMFLVISEQSH